MNIGQVARLSGLSNKTIRYYESIALIPPATRQANGYRDYNHEALSVLRFLRQARQFGFSLEECRELVALYRDPQRRSAQVHALVEDKLAEVDQRIKELRSMKKLLVELVSSCPNDEGSDCEIINTLSSTRA